MAIIEYLGNASFPGIASISTATMTMVRGIRPSVCTLTTVPQQASLVPYGDLDWFWIEVTSNPPLAPVYNTINNFTLVDCAIDFPSLSLANQQTWTIRILDRRWKWRFGEINGRYNQRDSKGVIIPETQKHARELCQILLDAMGESNYDTSTIPQNQYPEATWERSNPAAELQQICDGVAHHICLDVDTAGNPVILWENGEAAVPDPHPPADLLRSTNDGMSSFAKPSKVTAYSAPVVYQARLPLTAVALDADDTIQTLQQVSYAPDNTKASGGFLVDIKDQVADLENRRRANQSVFRWFKIDPSVPYTVPGSPMPPDDQTVDDLRSFRWFRTLARPLITDTKPTQGDRARIYGKFYNPDGLHVDNANDNPNYQLYDGNVSVDTKRGIVKTQDQLAVYVDLGGADYDWDLPVLWVEIAFEARPDFIESSSFRAFISQDVPNAAATTKEYIELHDDIVNGVIQNYDADGNETTLDDNITDVNQALNYYVDAILDRLADTPSGSRTYSTIQNVNCSGLVTQVSWSVGGGPAQTVVSEAFEHNRIIMPYAQAKKIDNDGRRGEKTTQGVRYQGTESQRTD